MPPWEASYVVVVACGLESAGGAAVVACGWAVPGAHAPGGILMTVPGKGNWLALVQLLKPSRSASLMQNSLATFNGQSPWAAVYCCSPGTTPPAPAPPLGIVVLVSTGASVT